MPWKLEWREKTLKQTPMKGATLTTSYCFYSIKYFNPRTHEGCDENIPILINGKEFKFQSTHPWRVRLVVIAKISLSSRSFQSTHPWGVRQYQLKILCFQRLFQSTHPWGVRRYKKLTLSNYFDISIHAPMRGATHQKFC